MIGVKKDLAMPTKTLLSVIGVDHEDRDLLDAAALAQDSNAHLTTVVVSASPPPPAGDLTGQSYSVWALAWADESSRVEARAAALGETLGKHGFEADVRPVYCLDGNVDEEVARQANYVDATLVGRLMLDDRHLLKQVLNGALFASPAPVILSAGRRKATLSPKRVLVAWNAALEASVAVRQAMDMLVQADSVHVVLVDPTASRGEMGEEPGADVATFLSRRGAKVTVETLASGGNDPALVLQRHASDIGADLIVMGAYGHSRMRERLFGGTTQSMLANIETPVLMAR